jgi:hypothetical protein
MYPAPHSNAVVTALVPPNVLPTKVKPPVDGCARENCDSVLASSAIATAAAMIVSGAAMPRCHDDQAEAEEEAVCGADVRHRGRGDVDQPRRAAMQPFG